jgi:DNA helicase II / ATP-dependent DNA helicase PcrA
VMRVINLIIIPGRIEDANYDVQLHIGESRDSGSGPSDHPGMTKSNEVVLS